MANPLVLPSGGLRRGAWRGAATPLVALVLVPLALLIPRRATAQQEVPSLSSARVAAQVGVGALASPVAFFGAGIATKRLAIAMGASDEGAGRAAYVAAYGATWLAAAAVPAAIGGDGRFPSALGGSALGMLAAKGLVAIGNWRYDANRRACGVLCWTLGAAVVALPSVGATIAYDRSRR